MNVEAQSCSFRVKSHRRQFRLRGQRLQAPSCPVLVAGLRPPDGDDYESLVGREHLSRDRW